MFFAELTKNLCFNLDNVSIIEQDDKDIAITTNSGVKKIIRLKDKETAVKDYVCLIKEIKKYCER